MAITVYDACTARKKSPKFLIINDFAIPSSPFVNLSATFRDNIRSFLREYAEKEDYTVDGNTVSCIFLASEATGVVFPLFTVEEQISDGSSPNPLCDFCRCVGWGHHYVSRRKYHLIIPTSDEWKKPLTKRSLKVTSHLMHGVIHCNGFGHLISINGGDGSDNNLSGGQIMNLWDRLCSTLHTRKISLDDISRKGSMDLRLLHGVAYGRPWFGKWGYSFSHGSFGVREERYSRAINILRSIEVDQIMDDFSGTRKERAMKMMIGFYREASETPLTTLSDLLRFMLAYSSKTPVERKTAMALVAMSLDTVPMNPAFGDDDEVTEDGSFCSSPDQESYHNGNESVRDTTVVIDDDTNTLGDVKPPVYPSFDALAKGEQSRYPVRRLKDAAQAVVKVIGDRNSIITRQELREAVRNSIGDTGLIDFLLKHIDKVLIGDTIVQRFTNPESRTLQFSLRKVVSRPLDQVPKRRKKTKPRETSERRSTTPGLDPYDDILYLYQNLLLSYADSDIYSDFSEDILNCKSFVKEWPLPSYQDQNRLTVSCQVLPNHQELLEDFTRKLPPGEVVMVPKNSTIRELKSAAEKALRDTYCIMESFEALEIKNNDLEKIDETVGLKSKGNEFEFLVTGFGLDTVTALRYEAGFDDWTVDCKCGARDDDGERMVACDDCKVWHHTKCNSIEDDEAVPSVFLCDRCFGVRLRSKKRCVAIR
ncbi:unnamed protein product [Thlaspi arvense]|uniref:Zinc finger PHD-type domain-containing protein n=1 Tax=Thlaspi arvense TaxID=13288 RepID=A0AAU9RLG4_THLAR|nr:unnamed protein product [Thlaspi arvense]